ncbi:MAG: hypothetical protein NVSMB34_00260 [Variovorax sp.]
MICATPPAFDRLALLDARADVIRKDGESMTDFLESPSRVASQHVLNVAGSQRMPSRRIAKLCFVLAT